MTLHEITVPDLNCVKPRQLIPNMFCWLGFTYYLTQFQNLQENRFTRNLPLKQRKGRYTCRPMKVCFLWQKACNCFTWLSVTSMIQKESSENVLTETWSLTILKWYKHPKCKSLLHYALIMSTRCVRDPLSLDEERRTILRWSCINEMSYIILCSPLG